jgi:hypothetical protein
LLHGALEFLVNAHLILNGLVGMNDGTMITSAEVKPDGL